MTAKEDTARIRKKILSAAARAKPKMQAALKQNADDIVSVARALTPRGETGRSKARVRAVSDGDDAVIIDFGALSAIREGGTEVRQTKTGANRGRAPAQPVVGPALKATKRRRRARMRKAIREALKGD